MVREGLWLFGVISDDPVQLRFGTSSVVLSVWHTVT